MRGLLIAAGVLGIALVFGQCERAPAGAVTSHDVELLSEQVSLDGPDGFGMNGNTGKNSRGNRGRGGGRYFR